MKQPTKLKLTVILREVRRSVSEILGRPFTERIDHQQFRPDQRLLALWAADCATHVLPYFEEKYPHDKRPRKAIEALHEWIITGKFSMKTIRRASLSAHAAAKRRKELEAIYAAHAAGQAVGTAHVVTHSFGCSIYAIRAAAAHSGRMEDALKERDWQLKRLKKTCQQFKMIFVLVLSPFLRRPHVWISNLQAFLNNYTPSELNTMQRTQSTPNSC